MFTQFLWASVELDEIFRVNLVAVKDNVNLWIGYIVHAAIKEVGIAGIFRRRSTVQWVAQCVFSDQHPCQEHGLVRRLAGKYRRRQAVLLQSKVVFSCRKAEFTGVFGIPGKIAS